MSALTILLITIGLIVLSAFFVVIEFALLGARRHRLEEEAATSRSARAALKSVNELTMMLAVAQLGITACTFALGAITKPGVEALLEPLFTGWMPEWVSTTVAFVLALLVVTFLHLVVGEMAPKSWAIAHPELSAKVIGLPSRAFVTVLRPLLRVINAIANRLVAATGVEPVDRAAVGGQDAATIRHLVEHSAQAGVLEPEVRSQISGVLDLQTMVVETLIRSGARASTAAADASVADVQATARRTGHLRILIDDGDDDGVPGVVHVRDTLLAEPAEPASMFARPAYRIEAGTLVHEALTMMQADSVQLAIVMRGTEMVGVVTLADVLRHVLPPVVATAGAR
ncbi:CNNM domain-containing protein [Microcella sp.]|uniref:CNNM domain-containing protein n=1 Tax=Microcella sp. TaxID=1913979 RepID=UPI00391BC0D6